MKVGEMKEALAARGLSTDGKKGELQKRLQAALSGRHPQTRSWT